MYFGCSWVIDFLWKWFQLQVLSFHKKECWGFGFWKGQCCLNTIMCYSNPELKWKVFLPESHTGFCHLAVHCDRTVLETRMLASPVSLMHPCLTLLLQVKSMSCLVICPFVYDLTNMLQFISLCFQWWASRLSPIAGYHRPHCHLRVCAFMSENPLLEIHCQEWAGWIIDNVDPLPAAIWWAWL
jgi:hypothetical protein